MHEAVWETEFICVHLCADMIIWGILLSAVLCAVMGKVWGCCWVHMSLEIVYKILTKWSKIWITNISPSFRKDVLHSLLSSLLTRMKCVSLEFTCIDTCCHLLWGTVTWNSWHLLSLLRTASRHALGKFWGKCFNRAGVISHSFW